MIKISILWPILCAVVTADFTFHRRTPWRKVSCLNRKEGKKMWVKANTDSDVYYVQGDISFQNVCNIVIRTGCPVAARHGKNVVFVLWHSFTGTIYAQSSTEMFFIYLSMKYHVKKHKTRMREPELPNFEAPPSQMLCVNVFVCLLVCAYKAWRAQCEHLYARVNKWDENKICNHPFNPSRIHYNTHRFYAHMTRHGLCIIPRQFLLFVLRWMLIIYSSASFNHASIIVRNLCAVGWRFSLIQFLREQSRVLIVLW